MTEQEIPNAHYAINVSKMSPQKHLDVGLFDIYIAELNKRISDAIGKGMSVRSVITPLLTTGCIFGPFENEKGETHDLKSGDCVLIDPMVKHWVDGIETSQLVLLK